MREADWLDLEPEVGLPQLKPHGLSKVDELFSQGNSEMPPGKEGIDVDRRKENMTTTTLLLAKSLCT